MITTPCMSVISFQPTLPVWGATGGEFKKIKQILISTHAPRVGSDLVLLEQLRTIDISIHAPRVGSDFGRCLVVVFTNISIHAPHVGSDGYARTDNFRSQHFNPRSPCGERRVEDFRKEINRHISIHAPRVGSDPVDA